MKILLLLLATLCGLSAGLQYPFSYEYQYSGEVKTGVHELRNQFAGARITANVKIAVVSSSEAHVQINEPKVGSVNADVPSSGRDRLPIESMQLIKDKAAVEQSFVIHFSGQQEKLMVPSGELLWISNLRKSIISLLRVPFVLSTPVQFSSNVRENRIASQNEYPTSFKKEEETIHGKCTVLYTLTRASQNEFMHLKELKQDAQQQHRQQQRSHQESNSTYRLVRSIDFDDCKDRVVLKKSSHGNLTEAGMGQLRGIQSRSVVGEYLLTGEPSAELSMRVEQAIVEGVTTVNPFGHETKKIMTFTNQTLSLVSVSQTSTVPAPSSSLKQEIWAFRVNSPFQAGAKSPSWISFQGNNDATAPMFPEQDLTGYSLTPQLRDQLQSHIKSAIDEVSRQVQQPNDFQQGAFGGSRDGAAVQKIDSVASKLRALETQDIEKLFREIVGSSASSASLQQNIKRELFISSLKAAGSAGAYKVLIEKTRNGDITPFEAANLFVSMTASVQSPAVIPDLIDYVMSLPDDASIALKTSALINLSTLIRRLCLNPAVQAYSTPVEMMGLHQCSQHLIKSKYIPYLRNKVQSVSKSYLRAIYIQSLANLGDHSSVALLGHIALGNLFRHQTPMRLLAIQGLSKNHMVNTSYPLATETLLALAEDQVEKPVLREAAIASLFSLPKNATFWHRMAMSTWREPSRRVASFIYTTIKSHAASKNPHYINQISMAKHALPLAKPQPRSPYYSGHLLSSHYETSEDMAGIMEGIYLSSGSSEIPQALAARFKTVFGGMKFPMVHVSAIGKGLENTYHQLMDKFMGRDQVPKSSRSSNNRRSVEEWSKAINTHKSTEEEEGDESDNLMLAHLTIFKHLEIFAPITSDSVNQFMDPRKSMIASAIQRLQSGETVQGLSYYTSADATEILPSEIGLPIISHFSQPSMIYSQVKGSARIVPQYQTPMSLLSATYLNISGEAITKVVLKSESSVKILIPWTNETLLCGMDGERTFSLPAKFSAGIKRDSSSETIFQFSVQPNFQSKSPIMVVRNLPFTAVRKLFPNQDISEEAVKPINVLKQSQPRYQSKIQISRDLTGMSAELQYQGDTEFPINRTTIGERLMRPMKAITLVNSPTSRQYQMALVYNADESQTKQITGTISYVSIQQQGPRSSSMSSSTDKAPVVQDLSATDSMQQRISKLSSAGVSSMLSGSVNFSGPAVPIKYEAAVLIFPQHQQQSGQVARKQSQFQVNIMRTRTPSRDRQAEWQACVSSSVEYPSLPADARVDQVLSGNLDVSFASQIYSGSRCNQNSQYYSIKGKQSISEERKQHLQALDVSRDQYQPLDSTQAVKASPVYDILNVDIKQVKAPSDGMRNLTNHLSDIAHGVLFPSIIHNGINVQGQQGLTVLQGTRSLATDRYTFWVRTSDSICLVQDLKVFGIFDYASPLNDYWQPAQSSSQKTVQSGTSDRCHLTPDSARTFAGVQYKKAPSKCSTIAVKSDKESNEKFLISTQQTEESASADQELKIIYPRDELVIHIKRSEILVNGAKILESQTEVKTANGRVVARVFQSSSVRQVELPNKFVVQLKEGRDAIIQMSQRYRSQLAGTCGHFGTDTAGDLSDSHQCLYTPSIGDLYSAAWIASSDLESCKRSSSPSIQKLIQDVKVYQQTCPKSLQQQAGQRKPRKE